MVIWGRSVCVIPAGDAAPFCLGVLGPLQQFARQFSNASHAFSLLKWEIVVHAYRGNSMLLAVVAYCKTEWLVSEAVAMGGIS